MNQAWLLNCPANSLVTIPTEPMIEKSTGNLVRENMHMQRKFHIYVNYLSDAKSTFSMKQ
jgi:hypothetical protein